jgi:hypothetical protein
MDPSIGFHHLAFQILTLDDPEHDLRIGLCIEIKDDERIRDDSGDIIEIFYLVPAFPTVYEFMRRFLLIIQDYKFTVHFFSLHFNLCPQFGQYFSSLRM